MKNSNNLSAQPISANPVFFRARPKPLYNSEQVYAIEQAWFAAGYNSFALMQQAAWQMAQYLIQHAQAQVEWRAQSLAATDTPISAVVWVGAGNNGGDGWLMAHYLLNVGWQVTVVDVGQITISEDSPQDNDAAHAKTTATKDLAAADNFTVIPFSEITTDKAKWHLSQAHYHVDALFGIGLDRSLTGHYAQAIRQFNALTQSPDITAVAVDIPSGVVASTGQVFDDCAIKADLTLCLVASKVGLTIRDGIDHIGAVIDFPLIPYLNTPKACAWQLHTALSMSPRQQNSHKGSYGHVMIIGGNQSVGAQGMGGAAIMSSGSALASGAGKVTTACHTAFHGALLTTHPNAMTVDLQQTETVDKLLAGVDVVAIGMGFGREEEALVLFKQYLQTAITEKKPLVIDADGLYHLATLHQDKDNLIEQLKAHTAHYQVCFTPHSGEAARLLDKEVKAIEANRLVAIHECAEIFGGDWLLKGPGSLVLIEDICYVCSTGNPGMASAGMGDVLSGLLAGLMAQTDLAAEQRSLYQAVLIHGMAGDLRAHGKLKSSDTVANKLAVGERGLQAHELLEAIGCVMNELNG
ncbi:NAD(P)H-hydrate dehydratase [Psychrobacter arenosus]|uniref:NAD(P)H-hydrate dehydratase n=1 Tax=Psychrobacter arenosus TaxID=256326 RepID=UPI001917AF9A|nr:NAD(P)H-hydrate dehydratase [Psychrobacter arenosus]